MKEKILTVLGSAAIAGCGYAIGYVHGVRERGHTFIVCGGEAGEIGTEAPKTEAEEALENEEEGEINV